ncbi:aromatic ring-opening dioxygenase LigA [Tessaracoccus antarcticus]|uniref:Aromatic ring-opening dioxygenase LigA n=1 Tax=Tessaracoccus antarcticus TaxID=2479848 RepID=A0A3M0G959_9ACTN|nr:aromatic ring-opening dioxygenase LigA [Tessaracoccus antarcticus]RMB58982.1 aromatic ring-opening dioxygenase LigA [Tessaracoccus antarcticus]
MKNVKVVGMLSLIAGIIMIVAGGITYGAVSQQLAAENIVVPDDAAFLGGDKVDGPFSAYAQADIINHHALEASEGKTYAELGALSGAAKAAGDQELADKYQGQRDTVMTASFLRASLFTSVLAFGVAALVIGLGVMFGLIGWAFMGIRPAARVDVRDDAIAV